MMMLNNEKKRIIRILFLSILASAILLGSTLLLISLYQLQRRNSAEASRESALGVQRDYSVLVTGSSDNENFLKQIYEGASIVSNFFDSATQYYIPEKKLENRSDQFYYAGFTNADCVITYLDSDLETLYQPRTVDGKSIPLVTVGSFNPNVQKIFHIGIDYDELAKQMANEVINFFANEEGTLYILDIERDEKNPENLLLQKITKNLQNQNQHTKKITIYNSVVNKTELEKNASDYAFSSRGYSLEDEVRQQFASLGKIDLILALSEKDTLLAVQTVLDLNSNSRTKIIGFGDTQESLTYFKKGFVSELFSADAVDIGKKAMQHFFEYKNDILKENYFVADIKLLKSDSIRGENFKTEED